VTTSDASAAREPGRRERNKADKRRRIEAAARELFSTRGFSSVTTQEVARLADVGTGTLFRYAQSKGELLCMVANEDFRPMFDAVPDTGDPVEDLLVLCDPVILALARQPENVVAYHRETLFGERGPHRTEALRILTGLRDLIALVLARHAGDGVDEAALDEPAQTVFDVIYMELVRAGIAADAERDHRAGLRGHIHRVLHGVLPDVGPVP